MRGFKVDRPWLGRLRNSPKRTPRFRLPMAAEFAEFLMKTTESERDGFVFNPSPRRPGDANRAIPDGHGFFDHLRHRKAAGVKVADKSAKVKCASAHDFLRAFGFRWAMRGCRPSFNKCCATRSSQRQWNRTWDGMPKRRRMRLGTRFSNHPTAVLLTRAKYRKTLCPSIVRKPLHVHGF